MGKDKVTCTKEGCTHSTNLDKDGYCLFHQEARRYDKKLAHVWKEEGLRKNEGKPRIGKVLLMPVALSGLARVMEWGEQKYSAAENKAWLKYDPDEILDSMMRHAMAMKNGEFYDRETGLPHAFAALFNAAAYTEITCHSCEDSYGQKPHVNSSES